MKKFTFGLIVFLGIIVAVWAYYRTGTKSSSPTLQVFSGAGLMHPMDELSQAYREKTGVNVQISYGGSGVLMGKLSTGQPCDVFIPGAAKYVNDAARNGWVDSASVIGVVRHVPILAVSEKVAERIKSLEDLARADVRVGLGDPEACAIGRTADLILERNGLADQVKQNVKVRTPTVNQLLIYLVTDQIDAAILWEDLVRLPEAGGKVRAIPIAPEKNVVSLIAAGRGIRCDHPDHAVDFINFLASPSAQEAWLKWGFTPCEE